MVKQHWMGVCNDVGKRTNKISVAETRSRSRIERVMCCLPLYERRICRDISCDSALICAAPSNSNSPLWFVLPQGVRVLAKAIAVFINRDLGILDSFAAVHLASVIMNFDDMMSRLPT